MAKREKKPVHKVVMTEGKRNIIQQLLQEYDIDVPQDRKSTFEPQIVKNGHSFIVNQNPYRAK